MKNLFSENRLVFFSPPGGPERPKVATENKEAVQVAKSIKKKATPRWIKEFKNPRGKTANEKQNNQAAKIAELMTKPKPKGLGYVAYKTDPSIDPTSRGYRGFQTPDGRSMNTRQFVSLCRSAAKQLNRSV